ncbi:DNA glycosylase [Gonapodya prolifera JEL478]|uniref:DNA glycosylase n=1 Tax=Gonapodya prolifera (strain JEL478) TaxID=1344416 RepID=A0A139AZ92_GONPJ|nr:DNA glycosylase [Gonapodya prolifera JEL478]|eukprot:KXS22072.1 DNA glycosylase [Gonapodya prolifera JEL478]
MGPVRVRKSSRSAALGPKEAEKGGGNQNLQPIPDHLAMDLDILFTGINPGIKSSQKSHHYAGPNNAFWPCLFESGLVDRPLSYSDDHTCPKEFSMGFTNLVSRPSRSASDISKQEFMDGVIPLKSKLLKYKPKVVCFLGKGIYETFLGRRVSPDELNVPHAITFAELQDAVEPSTSPSSSTVSPYFQTIPACSPTPAQRTKVILFPMVSPSGR